MHIFCCTLLLILLPDNNVYFSSVGRLPGVGLVVVEEIEFQIVDMPEKIGPEFTIIIVTIRIVIRIRTVQ